MVAAAAGGRPRIEKDLFRNFTLYVMTPQRFRVMFFNDQYARLHLPSSPESLAAIRFIRFDSFPVATTATLLVHRHEQRKAKKESPKSIKRLTYKVITFLLFYFVLLYY
jgi:hypothetical protein